MDEITVSDKQQRVLSNLERVTHDGSRIERRYELDGENVSVAVRSLITKRLIILDDTGALGRAEPALIAKPSTNEKALRDIRAALASAPPTTRRYPKAQRRRTLG